MSCKSALYAAMQTPAAVAVGGVIPLGSLIRRYGCDVSLNGNSVNITGAGYYEQPAPSPSRSTRTAWLSPVRPPRRPRPLRTMCSTSAFRRLSVRSAVLQALP